MFTTKRFAGIILSSLVLVSLGLALASEAVDFLIVPEPPDKEDWVIVKTYDTATEMWIRVCITQPVLTERQWFKALTRIGAPGGVLATLGGWLFNRWRKGGRRETRG